MRDAAHDILQDVVVENGTEDVFVNRETHSRKELAFHSFPNKDSCQLPQHKLYLGLTFLRILLDSGDILIAPICTNKAVRE